jgi:hypothetical protein
MSREHLYIVPLTHEYEREILVSLRVYASFQRDRKGRPQLPSFHDYSHNPALSPTPSIWLP